MAETKLFDANAEVALLSTLLKNPELVHTTNGLRFYMFSSTPHQALYEEIEDLLEKQLVPDPTLVLTSLESKGNLDKVGGKKYLEFLVGRDTKPEAFQEFIGQVANSYKGRSLISMASGIKKETLTSQNIDEVITATRKGLDGLIEMKGGLDVVSISDLTLRTYEDIVSRTQNPGISGVSWGSPVLDKVTGGKLGGDLIIVAARPGIGKTSALLNSVLTDGAAGIPSLIIEREMRSQQLMDRLISIDTGIPSTNIKLGILTSQELGRIRDSLAKLKKYPMYMDTNYRNRDPYYLEATVNKFHNKHGVQNVYLDYIQIATERDEGQTMDIGRLTQLFKVMANELGICSILLSQLNRGVEQRDDKHPMLSDLRQSGNIEEDADFVIGLYRDEYYNKETKYKGDIEYLILKNRNGPTGTVTLKFDGPTYRIHD